ncbi:MAG: thioesterase family protein [Microthrixaceae bacterium]|nr:thioesterase family protein [Microthrixaceae bacterium]
MTDTATSPIFSDGGTDFESDTAVEALGDGRFRARISTAWWIVMGPNGGYVAAIVLRAAVAAVADPARRPLSATFHYLRPPAEGEVDLDVTVERSGRGVTNVSVRMSQGGKLIVLALVALGTRRDGTLEFDEVDSPTGSGLPARPDGSSVPALVGDPGAARRPRTRHPHAVPLRHALGVRLGAVLRRAGIVGGHRRMVASQAVASGRRGGARRHGRCLDAPIFSRVDHQLAVPTVDLTVHFRGRPADPPGPPSGPEGPDAAWCFVRFSSPVSRGGYLVEHGSVWDSTGRLLADVRQLAVVL